MSIADQLKDKIVNPKDMTSYDNFDTKAVISRREAIIICISRARQDCGWSEKEKRWISVREIFFRTWMIVSRSVGGLALQYQKEGTCSRVVSEDRQTQKFEEKK